MSKNSREEMNDALRDLSDQISRYPDGEEKAKMQETFEGIKETAQELRENSDIAGYLATYDESGKAAKAAKETSDSAMDRMTKGCREMIDRVKTAGKAEEFGKEPSVSPSVAMKEETAKACRDIASAGKQKIQKESGMEKGVIEQIAHHTPVVKNVVKSAEAMKTQNDAWKRVESTMWDGMKDFIDPKNKDKAKILVETWAKTSAQTAVYLGRALTAQAHVFAQIGPAVAQLTTGFNLKAVGVVAEQGAKMADGMLDKADAAIDRGSMTKDEKQSLANDLKDLSSWATKELAPMVTQLKENPEAVISAEKIR